MKDRTKLKSALLVMLAGILWGSTGVFVRPLEGKGLGSTDIVFLKLLITAIIMAAVLLIKDRKLFRIRLKDLWCFVGTGIFSIVFFSVCYYKTIAVSSMSISAILLYTAPAFVILLSALLFKERLTKRRILALALAFTGLVFVTGVLGGGDRLTFGVLLTGLGSGLGYGLYSIFGRYALERGYDPLTINFYTFLLAAISSGLISSPGRVLAMMTGSAGNLALSVAFAVIVSVMPFLVYTIGLKNLENGQAAIIASIEPVVATLLGIIFFREKMTVSILTGSVLVLAGILVSNLPARNAVQLNDDQKRTTDNGREQ
ncbi:MAG: EamA family transporter [Eubacterium sp.]|nr:EamA family transporter [Eubacterium sp.]